MRKNMIHRKDENEALIVEALEAIGASVQSLGGKGIPDLLVGYLGANYLLEVKAGSAKLNPDQMKWHADWLGQVKVIRTIADAFLAIGFGLRVEMTPGEVLIAKPDHCIHGLPMESECSNCGEVRQWVRSAHLHGRDQCMHGVPLDGCCYDCPTGRREK